MAEAMTNEEVVGGNCKDEPAMEEELLGPETLDEIVQVVLRDELLVPTSKWEGFAEPPSLKEMVTYSTHPK